MTIGKDSKLTTIGNSAFSGCSSLTSIVIPSSVTTIGSYAFKGCSKLTISCEATSKPVDWDDNWNINNCTVIWDYLNAKNTEDGFIYHVFESKDGTKYIVIDAYIGTATNVIIPDTINVNGEEIPVIKKMLPRLVIELSQVVPH